MQQWHRAPFSILPGGRACYSSELFDWPNVTAAPSSAHTRDRWTWKRKKRSTQSRYASVAALWTKRGGTRTTRPRPRLNVKQCSADLMIMDPLSPVCPLHGFFHAKQWKQAHQMGYNHVAKWGNHKIGTTVVQVGQPTRRENTSKAHHWGQVGLVAVVPQCAGTATSLAV